MASLELRLRKDERLKRLAQEIIVTQQQEIAVMRLAVGDARSPRIPAPATGSWRWSRSAPTA